MLIDTDLFDKFQKTESYKQAEDMSKKVELFFNQYFKNYNINKKVSIDSKIGKGGFGLVQKGFITHEANSIPCAFKIIENVGNSNTIKREMRWLKLIGSQPGIVQVMETMQTEDFLVLVMDLMLGDLKELNQSVPFADEDEEDNNSMLVDLLKQLSEAFYFLHRVGVFHNDIKPNNILQRLNGDTTEYFLSDFGASSLSQTLHSKTSADTQFTEQFRAPKLSDEKFTREQNASDDLFSLGITIMDLLVEKHPQGDSWKNYTEVKGMDFTVEKFESNVCKIKGLQNDKVKQFLEKSLKLIKTERLTTEEFQKLFHDGQLPVIKLLRTQFKLPELSINKLNSIFDIDKSTFSTELKNFVSGSTKEIIIDKNASLDLILNITENLFENVQNDYKNQTNWVSWIRTILPLWPDIHNYFNELSTREIEAMQTINKIKINEVATLNNWQRNNINQEVNKLITTVQAGDLLTHHQEYLKEYEQSIKIDLQNRLKSFDTLVEEKLIEKIVIDENFMKTFQSLQSKVVREGSSDPRSIMKIFSRDIFRMRIQMIKGAQPLTSANIIKVLEAAKNISDDRLELTRVKAKIKNDQWPKQYIFNFWSNPHEVGIEIQIMLCQATHISHFYYDISRSSDILYKNYIEKEYTKHFVLKDIEDVRVKAVVKNEINNQVVAQGKKSVSKDIKNTDVNSGLKKQAFIPKTVEKSGVAKRKK